MPTMFMAMAMAKGIMLVMAIRLGSNMENIGRERI